MSKNSDKVYDVGSGHAISCNDVAKYIVQKTQSKSQLKHLPMRVGEALDTKIAAKSHSELLKKIPWKEIDDGIPCLIHGDLQFQNILYNPQKEKFLLIDWRQDFAGHTNFGDLYYDLAKLYGGIKMNYDYIMKDLYHFEQNNQDAHVNFNNWENDSEYEKQLEDFIERKGFELKKVKLLTGLIYGKRNLSLI